LVFQETKPIVKDSLTIIPIQGPLSQEIINKEALKTIARSFKNKLRKTGKALRENNIEQRKVLKSRESKQKRARENAIKAREKQSKQAE
jgi:hypothetical protein